MDGASLPIAGWYPDPAGSPQFRWWDGSAWTQHLHERSEPQPASAYVPTYVTMDNRSSLRAAAPVTHPYAGVRSSTAAVWVIAIYTLPYYAIVLAIYATVGLSSLLAVSVIGSIVFFLIWGMAIWDHSVLEKRGIPASSVLWMFLSPIGYLIARRVRLKNLGIPANSPGNVYAIGVVAAILLSVIVSGPIDTSVKSRIALQNLETQAATVLDNNTTSYWTVNCPADAPVTTVGALFVCQASDTTGDTATVRATVIAPEQFKVTLVPGQTGTTNS